MQEREFPGSGLPESMMRVSRMQTEAAIELTACLTVSRTVLLAMLRCLPAALLAEVESAFRENIEGLLEKSDDTVMPEEFYRAFFNELNIYLRAMAAP